ncbi:hypothetical protein L6R29_09695 [Myxococcota bacterium]|nr:hypothetical protein [Myxococcota bacterium]
MFALLTSRGLCVVVRPFLGRAILRDDVAVRNHGAACWRPVQLLAGMGWRMEAGGKNLLGGLASKSLVR